MSSLVAADKVLAVDLDGTLLKSDLLLETFWAAIRDKLWLLFLAPFVLIGGRERLKIWLASNSSIPVDTLPYDQAVVSFVKHWKAAGGRAVLVTASTHSLAKDVADHIGLFDQTYGSTSKANLKGAAKANLLREHYGSAGYLYIGDASADIPVWAQSCFAIICSNSPWLAPRVARLGIETAEIRVHQNRLASSLKALRVHQWIKNLLVFVPMLAAHRFDHTTVFPSAVAFFSMCLVASGTYLLNDLLDLTADRSHPEKRKRPLASGDLSIGLSMIISPALVLSGLAVAAMADILLVYVHLAYVGITLCYSVFLKQKAIFDIATLALLYTTRIVAGGFAAGVSLSVWLLSFSLFVFFSLAATKRVAELVEAQSNGDGGLQRRGYVPSDLPFVSQMSIASGLISVLVLMLYVNSENVKSLYSFPEAIWGVSFVLLFWTSRMSYLAWRGQMHHDPVLFAVRDKVSLCCAAIVGSLYVAGTFG